MSELSEKLTDNIDVKYCIQTILEHVVKEQFVDKVSSVCICWQSAFMVPWSKTIVCIKTFQATTDAALTVYYIIYYWKVYRQRLGRAVTPSVLRADFASRCGTFTPISKGTKIISKNLWKVSSGWHENYINYSLDNQNNILCYRHFDFTSEVFIRTDFRYRSSHMRREELPIEPRMGQALTYWRMLPEVSPDEDFQCEVETSITNYVILVV